MAAFAEHPIVMQGAGWPDYALLDSGHGRKIERYGPYCLIRPEPQAMWAPRLLAWQADGEFVPGSDEDGGGRWHFDRPVPPEGWPLEWREVRFTARCTPFRHLGLFPDMAPVWDWMRQILSGTAQRTARNAGGGGGLNAVPSPLPVADAIATSHNGGGSALLNLFAYTGIGTLVLSRRGPVTHVDASRKSVAEARENAALSGLAEAPIRWLVDDASKFAAREVRRGKRYDGIILDPPKFGRGPKGETWRLEQDLAPLLADCRRLIDEDSAFLFLTVYAVRLSSLAIGRLLAELCADLPGRIEHGELAMREESAGEGGRGRLLPTAIFARWSNS